jgi:hypothetical protein
MALSFSTFLKHSWLKSGSDGSLGDLLNLCQIKIMKGTKPTDADATCTETDLLATIDSNGTGGTFATAAGGVLFKTVAEVWSTAHDSGIAASGTATWFRLGLYADEADYHTADPNDATYLRIDGTVGVAGSGADLILASADLVHEASLTIDVFQINLP